VQCWRTLCSTAMRCLGAMPLLCECVHIDDDAEASKEAPSGHLSQGMADRHDESM
jgi:phosphohistidine phosphatase SixA